jgi:hypothetical protein
VKEVAELIERMQKEVHELEVAFSYYQELAKEQPTERDALERLVYKGEFLKEHMLKQLFLLRKQGAALDPHGKHHHQA